MHYSSTTLFLAIFFTFSSIETVQQPVSFHEVINILIQESQNNNIFTDEYYKPYSLLTNFQHFKTLSNTTIFTECWYDLMSLVNATRNNEKWALKFIDSWGKPSSGIMHGNLFWLGSYDECVEELYQLDRSYVSQPYHGKYCIISKPVNPQVVFRPPSLAYGFCVPHSCNERELVSFIQNLLPFYQNITENYINCVEHRSFTHIFKKQSNSGTIVALFVISSLVLIIFTGTLFDLRKISTSYFLAEFSCLRVLSKIFTFNESADSFKFLNGIRVLSLLWVIFGHTFVFSLLTVDNIVKIVQWTQQFSFQFLLSAVFGVDTFFVISGFLTAVLFTKEVNKSSNGLNVKLCIMYYVHRFIRLTPTLMLITMASVTLTPYFGHGPFFPVKGFESAECHQYWWVNLLYLNNFIKTGTGCTLVSWYLANDMQFHWVAPLALIPFVLNRRKIAISVVLLFVLVTILSTAGIVLHYPGMENGFLSRSLMNSSLTMENTFFDRIYIKPWCRIAPYALGLLTGFGVINVGRTYRINIYIKIIGSCGAFLLVIICMFTLYIDAITTAGLSRTSLIVYQSLSRTGWGLAICWLLFLCSTGNGGIISKILSWPIWTPMARLNYAAYLIHTMIILVTNFNRTTPIHYQHIMAINSFVSQAFFSYVGAILVVILFESPFVVLEKRLFRNQKRHASDHGENKFLLNRGEEIESSYGSISELQNRSGSC